MTSIRSRLTLGLLAGVLGLSLVSAPVLYVSLRRALLGQFDAALTSKASALGTLLKLSSHGDVRLDLEGDAMPGFNGGRHPEYFEVFTRAGTPLARSPSLGGNNLLVRPGVLGASCSDVTLPNARSGRIVQVEFVPEEDDDENDEAAAARVASTRERPQPMILVVARDRTHIDEMLRALLLGLIASSAIVSGLTILLVTHTVRRGLAPLSRLADQAAAADVSSLTYRFSPQGLPTELLPICGRLNDLLERLATARERERRFTADVAHELRTPITELRALCEVALKWPADATTQAQSFKDALDVARQMEAIVTTLLALARCDSKRQAIAGEDVNLSEIVRGAWKRYETAAQERALRVELALSDDACLVSDHTLLTSVVRNLLSNAVEHTPRGGQVRCSVARSGNTIEIVFANTNDALRPSDLPHIFEPFWRKDPARSQSTHTGLGLSLVAAYAELLGAAPRTELSDGLFEIGLRFDVATRPEQGIAPQ